MDGVRLYDTMTQRLVPLEPLEPGHVKMYVCGVTTYDHAHAGHARTYTAFDVLARFLRARGYRVTCVRNVTDVDDKIVKRARENGEPPLSLSRRMSDVNDAELAAIGVAPPDAQPRVSEYIAKIVDLIGALVDKGAAYPSKTDVGTDVYFSVRSFDGYGKLSHRQLDDLKSGARVEVGEAKRDPLDFALWKAAGPDDLGWESPWGRGRPGWHIECSAMAADILTPHFDVHCGGMDLIFPHHENEIAQSEAAWGAPFSRVWLHSGFLNVDAEKMSKSLGNFVTIPQLLERNDPEGIRYFLLGQHYRSPISFDIDRRQGDRVVFPGIDEAERRVDYLYLTREALVTAAGDGAPDDSGPSGHAKVVREAKARVFAALDDDLNTSVTLSIVGELAKAANEIAIKVSRLKKDPAAQSAERALAAAAIVALDACCVPVGLMQATARDYFSRTRAMRLRLRGLDEAAIDAKVQERSAARAARDFSRGDALRDELASLGIELKDADGATTWRVVT